MFTRSPSFDSHRKPYVPSTAGNSHIKGSNLRHINQLSSIEETLVRRLDADDWRRRADSTKQSVLLEQIDRKVLGDMMTENEKLNDLVRIQRVEIEQLKHKLDVEYREFRESSEIEKMHLLERLEKNELEHQLDIEKLMAEIARLCQECNLIESTKKVELQKLVQQFDKDMLSQLHQNKKVQETNLEVCELQIKNLKEIIEAKGQQIETLKHQQLIKELKLGEEIKSLESRLSHEQQMKEIELRELRLQLDQQADSKVRNISKNNQISLANTESSIRKLRKELAEKIMDLEKAQNKMSKLGAEQEEELQILKSEKDRLRLELSVAENTFRDQMLKEKNRLQHLSEKEIQTLVESNVCYTNSLKSEIQKLYEMSEVKTQEIQRLNHEIVGMKELYKDEITFLKKDNADLQKRIKDLELENKTEIQTLKIKMGELHFNDVKGLEDLHTHNAELMARIIELQDHQNRDNRERVHKQLQQKQLLRKTFEIELSKERSKCLDLKVKLAAVSVEMKEQITSMASKMQLTSQTLLRQTENKQKGAAFFDEERRKLHQLIKAKDVEIAGLLENVQRLKEQIADSDKNHADQIGNLKQLIDELDESSKKQKVFYDNEINKLAQRNKLDRENLEVELEKSKESLLKPLQQQIDDLNREKAKFLKDLEHGGRELKTAQQNLAMREGMYETIQLQSSAALEEEKQKIKVLMSQHEIGLKQYFEEKVKSREKEILALKEQLNQKDIDIRALISKYNELENKLSEVLKVHDKFSLLQTKIMNLGMDNNLVKNLAELFKV